MPLLPSETDRPDVLLSVRCLRYEHRTILADLTMRLANGRWTCLLGPSGVGKSSLLRLLAGLPVPDADYQRQTSDGRPFCGRVAYMAQQDLLLPWLTIRDNVAVGSRLRQQAVDWSKVDDLLARVGLSDHAHKRPQALSGGQRQRAALARTLLEDGDLVLMDEPFSALDPITRVQMQDVAASLLRGKTVLLVTHDPFEALRVGDQVTILSGNPATLSPQPLPHDWPPPRMVNDPRLIALHGQLLLNLSQQHGGGEEE